MPTLGAVEARRGWRRHRVYEVVRGNGWATGLRAETLESFPRFLFRDVPFPLYLCVIRFLEHSSTSHKNSSRGGQTRVGPIKYGTTGSAN